MTAEQIVRALAAHGPPIAHQVGWPDTCTLCEAEAAGRFMGDDEHEPDCPWRLSVEWCAAEDARQANMAAAQALGDKALGWLASGDCRGPCEITNLGGQPEFACTRYGERVCVQCPGAPASYKDLDIPVIGERVQVTSGEHKYAPLGAYGWVMAIEPSPVAVIVQLENRGPVVRLLPADLRSGDPRRRQEAAANLKHGTGGEER